MAIWATFEHHGDSMRRWADRVWLGGARVCWKLCAGAAGLLYVRFLNRWCVLLLALHHPWKWGGFRRWWSRWRKFLFNSWQSKHRWWSCRAAITPSDHSHRQIFILHLLHWLHRLGGHLLVWLLLEDSPLLIGPLLLGVDDDGLTGAATLCCQRVILVVRIVALMLLLEMVHFIELWLCSLKCTGRR